VLYLVLELLHDGQLVLEVALGHQDLLGEGKRLLTEPPLGRGAVVRIEKEKEEKEGRRNLWRRKRMEREKGEKREGGRGAKGDESKK
jgi:hypothetical protein